MITACSNIAYNCSPNSNAIANPLPIHETPTSKMVNFARKHFSKTKFLANTKTNQYMPKCTMSSSEKGQLKAKRN